MLLPKRDRFFALDAMRGICAIIVALFHFKAQSVIMVLPFIKNGFLFVDFFFVLSGFVIAANYKEKLANDLLVVEFMFLRLGRIYPLHIFVLLLYATVAIIKGGAAYSLAGFLISSLLLQSFIPDDLVKPTSTDMWNFPSWSIAAEMWTYLVFALLSRNFSRRNFLYSLGLIAIISPVILDLTSDRYQNVFFFPGAIPRCLFGFSLGALSFELWQKQPIYLQFNSFVACTLLEVSALGASITAVSLVGAGPFSNVCTPLFAITILVFARAGGAVGSLFKTKIFAFIGALSYSIYMLHAFVQSRLLNLVSLANNHIRSPVFILPDGHQTLAGPPWAIELVVVVMVGLVIATSYFTFRWIEEPFRKLSKAFVENARSSRPIGIAQG